MEGGGSWGQNITVDDSISILHNCKPKTSYIVSAPNNDNVCMLLYKRVFQYLQS